MQTWVTMLKMNFDKDMVIENMKDVDDLLVVENGIRGGMVIDSAYSQKWTMRRRGYKLVQWHTMGRCLQTTRILYGTSPLSRCQQSLRMGHDAAASPRGRLQDGDFTPQFVFRE